MKVEMEHGEKCAICGKALGRKSAIVFYFLPNKIGGAWHAKCGPLPHIEGLTAKLTA